ncbi:MAG: RluA family pseudouridine synthase [Hyphomicrobiales bacterium]|nr:RluA family pseudouridine synthase [Hyphomicrobiales bacterium]
MAAVSNLALVVPVAAARERLDRFLAAAPACSEAHLSRSRLQALMSSGAVLVDGQPVTNLSFKLKGGEAISIDLPEPEPYEPAGEDIPLDIEFEDSHLIIINKPAGLVVHPAPGHADGTLVNALIHHCGDSLSGIGGVRRPGIVHRLDKDTSGLLVVAKSDAAHQGLAALFADHGRSGSLVRRYLALVWGAPQRRQGTIDAPLGRHSSAREKISVRKDGREAITHYRVLASFGPPGHVVASLVECTLETGRTHQIRVHMAHIGHPVMGDGLYGAGFRSKAQNLGRGAREALAAMPRQALHAATLGFVHPVTQQDLLFERAPPEDMARLIAALG